MKEVVLYYSMSGVTASVADRIAEVRGCDAVAIEPIVAYTSKTAFSKGVVDTKKGIAPEIKPLPNLSDCERVYLGTPIWAFGYAAPLNSVFNQGILSGKEVVLFSTSAGLAGAKSLNSVAEKLNSSKVITQKNFTSKDLKKETAVTVWLDSL